MVSNLAVLVGISMFFVLGAVGFVLWILWDRGKVAVEYRDRETGKVDWVKVRPTDKGVPFELDEYPNHMIRPDAEKMGTWEGSAMPWSYPLLTIDPHTGRQFVSREMVKGDPDMPEELAEVEAELISVPWAHVYWGWIDSDTVRQMMDASKPWYAGLQGALIIGMTVMSLAFLGMVWITQRSGAA